MLFLGGLLSAGFYFFLLIFMSNMAELLGSTKGTGWLTVIFCLLSAGFAASSVDSACTPTCVVASVALTLYTQAASAHIHGR